MEKKLWILNNMDGVEVKDAETKEVICKGKHLADVICDIRFVNFLESIMLGGCLDITVKQS